MNKTYTKQEVLDLGPTPYYEDEIVQNFPETFTLLEVLDLDVKHVVKVWVVTHFLRPCLVAEFSASLRTHVGIPMSVTERVGFAIEAVFKRGGTYEDAEAERGRQIAMLRDFISRGKC